MTSSSLAAAPRAASVTPRGRTGTALLIALLALGAYLRFANLADNPSWDGDEGYNWSIAANLAAGHVQMFALRYAFVQHPPLFYLLCAGLMRLWTHDLIALRVVSAVCGLGTIAGLFGLGTRIAGLRLGIAAATTYTIWPQAVLQIRWAYTYNLLAMLVVLALWAALSGTCDEASPGGDSRARRRRMGLYGAIIAGMLAGLALTADQEALPLVPVIGLLLWWQGRRQAVLGLVVAALPPTLYLAWMLAIRRSDLLFDLRHTATRLSGDPLEVAARLLHLLQFDSLIALGLLGMVFLPRGQARAAILILTGLLCLLILSVRDPAPLFRAAEPLLPLCALGLGALITAILDALRHLTQGGARRPSTGTRRARIAAVLLLAPLGGLLLLQDIASVKGHFATGLAPTLPRSALEARRMAAWVNARVAPTDLVIVMPATAWLLHCRTADLLQAVAASGHGTAFYPDGLRPDRFIYNPRLSAGRYLIVDDFTRRWIDEMPRERALVATAQRAWIPAYRHGEYVIYANPARYRSR